MVDAIQLFSELVIKNLKKHGFPENSVSFPIDKMYEESDSRGFSFNRVRELLSSQGILSELDGSRVVFTQQLEHAEQPSEADMMSAVQSMLGNMSAEKRDKLIEMVQSMSPGMVENIRKQWEAMSEEEQSGLMEQVKKVQP